MVIKTIYYIYSINVLTRSGIECEKHVFLALFGLKYHILCPFYTEIIFCRITHLLFKYFHLRHIKKEETQFSAQFRPKLQFVIFNP